MRREVIAILLAVVALVVAVVAFWKVHRQEAPPKTEVVAARCPGPDLASDTVSGCVCGAALVKVLVDLQDKEGRCVPEVTPASVCVAPGGAVRFKIQNGCARLDPNRVVVNISQPRFKRGLVPSPPPMEVLQSCTLAIQRFDENGSHSLLCDVAQDAVEGFYKYDLEGQIEPLDPDVEIRKGGGGN